MIKNLKIANKLIIAFLIVAVMAGIIGVVSFTSLNSNTEKFEDLYYNYGIPMSTITKINLIFEKNRTELRDMILDRYENIAAHEANIQSNADEANKLIQEFETTLKTEEDKKILEDLESGLVNYRDTREKIINLIKSKDNSAYSVLQTELAKALKPLTDDLDQLSRHKTDSGAAMDKKLQGEAKTTTLTVILVAVLAVILAIALGLIMTALIAKPIRKVANGAEQLAKGDTSFETDIKSKDETGILAAAFASVVNSVKNMIADANMLSRAAVEGNLAIRADASRHQGDYKKIIQGVNDTLDSVITPLNVAADYVEKISKGEIPPKITEEYKGDFNLIKNNLNTCIDAINGLIADANMLADAAVEGHLSTRADASQHQGDFKRIVEGVNATLEAVIKPVNEAITVLEEMSQGNLNTSVRGEFKGDHARIKNALNGTIGALKNYIGEISYVLGEMSQGNLDIAITAEYMGDFIALKDSINRIIDAFNALLSEISVSAEQVAAGTRQLASGNQAISQGATEQASSIEELSSSVSEIAEQTRQNAMNANKSNEMSLSAKTAAAQGNEQMKEMLGSMDQINESSENISKIIKVIDEIAFQTNLLALNAAVEAARAGAHGKGFAVVAEEVRNLAARSASAAKETTSMIEGSIKKVEAGTKIANETASALVKIVSGVEKTVELGGEIAVASNEQATGIAQINKGIEQLSEVVQNNSSIAAEGAAASEELSAQAELLRSKVEQFRLKNNSVKQRKDASTVALHEAPKQESKFKIALNDREFGKY